MCLWLAYAYIWSNDSLNLWWRFHRALYLVCKIFEHCARSNAVQYCVPVSLNISWLVKQLFAKLILEAYLQIFFHPSLEIDQRRFPEESAEQNQRSSPTNGGGPEDCRSTRFFHLYRLDRWVPNRACHGLSGLFATLNEYSTNWCPVTFIFVQKGTNDSVHSWNVFH